MSQRAKVLVSVDGAVIQYQTQGEVDVEIVYWDEFDHNRQSDQKLSNNFRNAFADTAKMLDEHRKTARRERAATARRTNHFWNWAARLRW